MRNKIFNYFFNKAPIAGFIFLIPFLLLCFSIISLTFNSKWMLTYSKFEKKYVKIDSLYSFNSDGQGSVSSWSGFSKKLNNYKTEISFGYLSKNEAEKLLEKYRKKDFVCVWYHPERKWASIAQKEDTTFPITEMWLEELYKFLITGLTFLNFIYWKSILSKDNK